MNHLKLLKLLEDNKRPFTPVTARIKASGNEASIYLYDPIVGSRVAAEWFGGICPQDFVPVLRALDVDHITLYTNCPGGDVFAAEAISQALREHPAKITMQIEGYAASAATSIACACDEVVATKGSKYMIHQSWTFAMGNSTDLGKVVELLNKCDNTMYDEYQEKTGQNRERIITWCQDETWFTAAEALQHGFIDSILEDSKPSAQGKWNLSAYAKAPHQAQTETELQAKREEHTQVISEDHQARLTQRLSFLSRI